MKLTVQIQLLPDAEQRQALLATFEQFNAAANYAAGVAFRDGVVSQPAIHHRCYYELRKRFGLSAQLAVRAIGKAAEVYRRDKTVRPTFKKYSAVIYDHRILKVRDLAIASLSTVQGRLKIPCIMGKYQAARMGYRQGQADLIYRKRRFYLLLTIVPFRFDF